MIEQIKEHFRKEYPKEGCGVIVEKQGVSKWIPCTNIAEKDDDFVIDTKQYLDIVKRYKILGIVHSHPDSPCTASENDKRYCNFLGIPYYIFSYPSMELEVLEPVQRVYNLIGKKYEELT